MGTAVNKTIIDVPQLAMLLDALRFYAASDNYWKCPETGDASGRDTIMEIDRGDVARRALIAFGERP